MKFFLEIALLIVFALLLSGCAHRNIFAEMEHMNTGHYPRACIVTPPPELSACEALGRDCIWRPCEGPS